LYIGLFRGRCLAIGLHATLLLSPEQPVGVPLLFIFRGLYFWRLWSAWPFSPWLGYRGDWPPTALAAVSLRPLIPSVSRPRCTTITFHLGFAGSFTPHRLSAWLTCMGPPMEIEVWVNFLSCVWADRATRRRHVGRMRSWPVSRNKFLSGHWPALGDGRNKCACRVDSPLNLPRDWMWVVPCRAVPQTAGRRVVGVLFLTLS
jgi:hypothetical protein